MEVSTDYSLPARPDLSEERKRLTLRYLISAAGADVAEEARREMLLRHLESADKAQQWNWQSTA